MLKKKSSSRQTVNKDYSKSHFVYKNNILIYPISEFEYKTRSDIKDYNCIKNNLWYIEVNNNGEIKTFYKKIKSNEIDDAIWNTINYYYKLLNEN